MNEGEVRAIDVEEAEPRSVSFTITNHGDKAVNVTILDWCFDIPEESTAVFRYPAKKPALHSDVDISVYKN